VVETTYQDKKVNQMAMSTGLKTQKRTLFLNRFSFASPQLDELVEGSMFVVLHYNAH
jgi:hypothetical protein